MRRRQPALHDRFERNMLLRKPLGDGGGGARLVDGEKPDVVAALVACIGAFLL